MTVIEIQELINRHDVWTEKYFGKSKKRGNGRNNHKI